MEESIHAQYSPSSPLTVFNSVRKRLSRLMELTAFGQSFASVSSPIGIIWSLIRSIEAPVGPFLRNCYFLNKARFKPCGMVLKAVDDFPDDLLDLNFALSLLILNLITELTSSILSKCYHLPKVRRN